MDEAGDRSGHSVAKGIGGVILAVILVNVLLRVVPLPDVDLPTISSFPDLPGWLEAVLKARKWVKVVGVIAVITLLAAARAAKRSGGAEPGG